MSRHVFYDQGKEVAYGYDEPFRAYFLSVYDPDLEWREDKTDEENERAEAIDPSGFKWVTYELIEPAPCEKDKCDGCFPFNGLVQDFGLMWVGEKFSPTPEDFVKEGVRQGVSKRINSIPNKFEINKDWILLAHMKAVQGDDEMKLRL